MEYLPTEWRPIPIAQLKNLLGRFEDWVLCGGHSVALITGQDTRSHGDIDIGVFRSQLLECLRVFAREQVFLCVNGAHQPWDEHEVSPAVHDIWITDRERKYWALQIMIFDDEGDHVIYRRDRRIRWAKSHHTIVINGIRVLNPFVTFLFKTNKVRLEEKEVHDLVRLIQSQPIP